MEGLEQELGGVGVFEEGDELGLGAVAEEV